MDNQQVLNLLKLDERNRLALIAILEEDNEVFKREFRPEVDEQGYLLRKDGTQSPFQPIQTLGDGTAARAGLGHLFET